MFEAIESIATIIAAILILIFLLIIALGTAIDVCISLGTTIYDLIKRKRDKAKGGGDT